MADLKDTIKALEICREMDNPPGWRTATCEDCPYKGDGCARKLKEDAAELLKSQPQIVHCKDCQHQDDLRYEVGGKFVCRKGHGWNTNDFFCADGEPRKPKDGDDDG